MRRIVFVLLISALLCIVGCGSSGSSSTSSTSNTGSTGTGSSGTGSTGSTGSGSTGSSGTTSVAGGNTIVTSGNNVAPLIVDAGPTSVANSSLPSINVAFATVTVCAPNSPTTCASIDHVMVDTGSSGLRILASVLSASNPTILAALQNVNSSTPIAECAQFLDNSYLWGTVRAANVEMGGPNNNSEVASQVPIQVIGDTSIPSAPSSCSQIENGTTTTSGTDDDTVAALGANGIIGVGTVQYDCDVPGLPLNPGSGSGPTFGIGSANPCASSSAPPPATYYTCSSSCSSALVPASEQVRNPVSMFADNNGVIIELPAVPTGGQATATGSLVFGIGTQSNNGLNSSAVVLPLDTNYADAAWTGFTTVFNNVSYPSSTDSTGSILDSGSNGIFFPDSAIPTCDDGIGTGWYCPASTESFTATNEAAGNSIGTQFNVSNADTLFGNTSYYAFSDLAAPLDNGFFDWGLPFFYGRNVYTTIWGVTPPNGVPAGPFWAY